MSFVLRGGCLIDPAHGQAGIEAVKDIWVESGKIHAVEDPGQIPKNAAAREISVQGYWVTPGFIDMHVHLREPGFEFKETIETGTRAAQWGGFTSVACMPNTQPVNDSIEITRLMIERGKQFNFARVLPIAAVTVGLQGALCADYAALAAAGACAFSDDGGIHAGAVMNVDVMREALLRIKKLGMLTSIHAEDHALVNGGVMNQGIHSQRLGLRGNPSEAESVFVAREIELARQTGARVHIGHLSTAAGVKLIRKAKKEGLSVSCEVTPHHLTLTDADIPDHDGAHDFKNTLFKMAPPLRTAEDGEALIEGLADGTVDCIATDHAPHSIADKQKPFSAAANGIIGLQTALPLTLQLVLNGRLSRSRWVHSLSVAPARLLGLSAGNQGVSVGSVADLTVIDPERKWLFNRESVVSKSSNSPYLGRSMQGRTVATVLEGRWQAVLDS